MLYISQIHYLRTAGLEMSPRLSVHALLGYSTSETGACDGDHERGAWWREMTDSMRSGTRTGTLQEVANVASKFETKDPRHCRGRVGGVVRGMRCERMGSICRQWIQY
ncbi:hypothetical protein VI817_005577 [Penicillium citrinum]|nr:hypothetical protein VI817_005577 [Penicillium citrinum]